MKETLLKSLKELKDEGCYSMLTNIPDSDDVFGKIVSVLELTDEIIVGVDTYSFGIRNITVWRRNHE